MFLLNSRALAAYSANLYGKVIKYVDLDKLAQIQNKSSSLMTNILSKADLSSPGKMSWTTGKDNKARDVELTAYIVLSLVLEDRLSDALQAIKWLATNRNSRGGFVSTQDTIVALQAISEYSEKIRDFKPELRIVSTVAGADKESAGQTDVYEITKDNELLFNRFKIPLPSNKTNVQFNVTGKGCFMAQSILRYNVHKSPDAEVFKLKAEMTKDVLEVCAAYDGGKEKTDMVVIEIELLSGYEPVTSSLEMLKNIVNAPVKKFEYDEKDRKVALYFNEVPKTETCWKMEFKRETVVEKLKPAIVKIYDYYDPKETFSTQYKHPTS